MTRVSVLIPAYNAEKTIKRSVNSVLGGDVQPFEILIYDDCSTDNTLEVIKKEFSNCDLVRVMKGQKNLGAGYARNVLLSKSKGDYIAFLDADDYWFPQKLDRQLNAIAALDLDVVTCSYEIHDETGKYLSLRQPIKNITFLNLHLTNWLPTSMTIFRRSLIGAQAMPDMRRRQDYAFWLSIFANNKLIKCATLSEPLGVYVKQNESLSSSKLKNLVYNYKVFREVMNYCVLLSATCVFANVIIRVYRM